MQPPPLPATPLPNQVSRTHVGPFLLLGLDKNADLEAIQAGWAQRLIWSRKNLIKIPLEDINWAREQLADSVRRLQADAASINLDTTDGTLDKLRNKFQGKSAATASCGLLDEEKSLADYIPPIAVPDPAEVRRAIAVPELPREFPLVATLLQELAAQPLDAWEWQ